MAGPFRCKPRSWIVRQTAAIFSGFLRLARQACRYRHARGDSDRRLPPGLSATTSFISPEREGPETTSWWSPADGLVIVNGEREGDGKHYPSRGSHKALRSQPLIGPSPLTTALMWHLGFRKLTLAAG